MIGNSYGHWVVIEKSNSVNQRVYWWCECTCGTIKPVRGSSLKDGSSVSCGCLRIKTIQMKAKMCNTARNQVINQYKQGARKRAIEYDLSDEDFQLVSQEDCHYCGQKPDKLKSRPHGQFLYNGLDRIDSDKGYHIDNIVSCCTTCNRAKQQMTQEEFKDWVEKVYHYLRVRG